MFRVGLIINENEASHSKYADTEATLRAAIDKCNGSGAIGNSYHFVVYNKFNIGGLFDGNAPDIAALNALVVATNALSFGDKMHAVLCANKARIDAFLDRGKGIFVSSQKKLSNGNLRSPAPRSVGFLPDSLDYYLFDRPEASSAEGDIHTTTASPLLEYPYAINDQLITEHCIHNEFMVHRYRSVIIPASASSYVSLLDDRLGDRVSQTTLDYPNGPRNLLMCSSGTKRLVASTMALDWANHAELLCNILTYITENAPRVFFVRKDADRTISPITSSYMIRANIANIPYRAIVHSEIQSRTTEAGDAFVFPPYWTSDEVRDIYAEMLEAHRKYFTIYHVCNTDVASDKNHRLNKYTNYSSIDLMKDEVAQALLLSYEPTGWGRSVWTYSYVLGLFERCGVYAPEIAARVYEELSLHFTKADNATGSRRLSGDYDGVVNATCKMLEILSGFARRYPDKIGEMSPFDVASVITAADHWLVGRIGAGAVFDQDVCYCLLYLIRSDKFDRLNDVSKTRLLNLFEQLLTRISEELLSGRIAARSSVDLCRVHLTLCILKGHKAIKSERLATYLDRIEITLRDRQDTLGTWRNVSDTAEISLMLLEAHDDIRKMGRDEQILNVLITKGIEALQSQYDSESSMWADDIATTARAMDAIVLYDARFNFSINDFFSDLTLHRESKTARPIDLTMERVRYFYERIRGLEKDRTKAMDKLCDAEATIASTRKRLSTIRAGMAASVFALVAALSLLVFLIVALYGAHREALSAILGDPVHDWRVGLVDAFIAISVTWSFYQLRKVYRGSHK